MYAIRSYYAGDDGDTLLELQETWSYTAAYTIPPTVTNILTNTASVQGIDPEGDIVSPVTATHSLDVAYAPVLSITKTGSYNFV